MVSRRLRHFHFPQLSGRILTTLVFGLTLVPVRPLDVAHLRVRLLARTLEIWYLRRELAKAKRPLLILEEDCTSELDEE